jgi:uncharacterized protein
MQKIIILVLFITIVAIPHQAVSQNSSDTIVLRDLEWDATSPAGMTELFIPSAGSLLQGLIYKANGAQKHPTMLLLHGFPGNERNFDLAQVVRSHGWNVIYFNYRGSWGSQGQFTFNHCVEDVVNVVAFCKKYADSLKIDTSNIALFGHSMGGWVCLKAIQRLPGVKKGFALSTWNIANVINQPVGAREKAADDYFVLNKKSGKELFQPVVTDPQAYNLANDAMALSQKQLVMLDEHRQNGSLAEVIKSSNKAFFKYDVWKTDHPFTNKRVSLIKEVLALLDK